ncbi:MAG TPA: dTDP-4-dehydrorhamnose reductase [Vicinamibacterales bacterium]|nr:dTDP-4-dehydrorhamnose reductase [Vicinamibacterales bacterium]
MRVLVTGAAGLLGSAVTDVFRAAGDDVHAAVHGTLDIVDAGAVERVVLDVGPDVVVNCAAYNDVDAAESDAVAALQVNAFGVRALAAAARRAEAVLVHYSSDFVFDGDAGRPYTEDDAPNPQSVYASSKLLGEWFAADNPRSYVLRVESLFGGPGMRAGSRRGSLGTIVMRIRAGEVTPVFVDRTVSPSYTPDVAAATRMLVARGAPWGTYHCVNAGAASWREIAEEAARRLGLELTVRELTLASMSSPARRPRYCALSPARLTSLGIVMPSWQDALQRFLDNDLPA